MICCFTCFTKIFPGKYFRTGERVRCGTENKLLKQQNELFIETIQISVFLIVYTSNKNTNTAKMWMPDDTKNHQ